MENTDKSKWCDMDYIENYIKEEGYAPKTSIENLSNMLYIHYEGDLSDNQTDFYAIEDSREYPHNLMINIEDLKAYVYDHGGLKEFDYFS